MFISFAQLIISFNVIIFVGASILKSSTPSVNFIPAVATSLERAFGACVAGYAREKERAARGRHARARSDT